MVQNKRNSAESSNKYLFQKCVQPYSCDSWVDVCEQDGIFQEYVPRCTYCKLCEDVCEQSTIWITTPIWEELQ